MKILVIKLRGLGDVLLCLPAINAIKENFPNSFITLLTEKGGDFFQQFRFIDEVLISNKNTIEDIRNIRKRKFDMIIDFFSTPKSAIISYLSGVKERVGFAYPYRSMFYTKAIKPLNEIVYARDVNFYLLEQIGIKTNTKKIELKIQEESIKYAKEFLVNMHIKNSIIVGISPSGGWKSKCWSITNFIELSYALKRKNISPLFLWGKGDERIVNEIRKLKNFFLIPSCSIMDMAAFIKLCHVIITNDNFIKHLSVMLDVPTITIFGATNPVAWNPKNDENHVAIYKSLPCQPCEKTYCKFNTYECLESISVDEVIFHCEDILKRDVKK
jgi:ADP-heptose:LPS heptosyltransferase